MRKYVPLSLIYYDKQRCLKNASLVALGIAKPEFAQCIDITHHFCCVCFGSIGIQHYIYI